MDGFLLQRLSRVTTTLLDRTRPAYSLRNEVLELKSILTSASGWTRDRAIDIAAGETGTAAGVAISPTMATMCVDDFARTVQFIRGLHAAIGDRQCPLGRCIRVLYAGCGPWATLAVPLMTVFSDEDVRFSLLDIHAESIQSVRDLLSTLGLTLHVESLEVGDAGNHTIADGRAPDVILVEMIRAALNDEPQVAVSTHLLRQAPNATLIPEEIRIELACDAAEGPQKVEVIAELMRVDRSLLLSEKLSGRDDRIPLATVTLPIFDPAQQRLLLLTRIRVFDDIVLSGNDCGITTSRVIPTRDIAAGDTLVFRYDLGKSPGVRISNHRAP